MTDTAPFTPDAPFAVKLTDSNGWLWQFAYWGNGFVYIREIPNELSDPMPLIGDDASRDDWPFLIDLNYYGTRPADVTAEWLDNHAAGWISGRNDDIKKGNL